MLKSKLLKFVMNLGALLSLSLILLSFKALAQQNNQTNPSKTLVHFNLTELRIRNQSPDTFFARFSLGFEQPVNSQNHITIDTIKFYDVNELEIFNRESITTNDGNLFTVGMYEGKFRAFNNYRDYPFDTHTLVIAFPIPQPLNKSYSTKH